MADDTLEKEEGSIPIRLREDEELDFFTELALHEVERWIQAVTRKKFEYTDDFRKSLSNGILLCELLNTLQPGSVKRINKLPGPIAGLDNVNVFLAACEKNFGLNKTQLFDSSDLEDLSNRAISDQNEYYLKQEVDRRARNVAITIFWLGKAVAGTYKGPALDASAFAALVHSHGNKNIISDECFKNDTTLTKENNRVTGSTPHTHIRDSSYDSLGSYERESESSFDELDDSGNMPVRSDMKEMRRYGSASSLSMPRDLRLTSGDSMYSDDNKNDSMYVSSPDLSQGSHAHTRSSSTDSEGNFYGNHSRQSSGSTDHHPGRRTSTSNLRRTSTSQPDPLQFVKLKGANELAENAKKIIEATKEVNIMRNKVDTGSVSEEPDWQSNFNNWKSRRKSTHTRLGDDPFEETMEEEKKQHKTFGQILAEKENRENRRSLGPMNIYPLDDNDSGIGVKSSQESPISKTTGSRTESKPKGNKSKGSNVAPWAQDSSEDNISQSDSETNNSHQSGDTDSVFSDKSNPSKVLSDDDSWVKNKVNAQMVSNKITPPLRTQRPLGDTKKLWETNANESQKKDNKKIKDLPGNSAKIKNITQAFEQKEKEANTAPVIVKRSEFTRSRMSKSLDLSDRSFSTPLSPVDKKPPSPLSPTAPKALIPKEQRFSTGDSQSESQIPDNSNKKFTEQTIKINQKPNNEKGFGFVLVGGVEKKQPVTVQKVSLGTETRLSDSDDVFIDDTPRSAADVCEVEANDELISINGRDVTTLTLAQVQGIVDHSVKRGQIELRVKRYLDEDQYDSVEDNAFMENKASVKTSNNNNNNNNNTMDAEINSHMSEPPDKHGHFKPTVQMSARSDEPPRLMDQLIEEQQREANNKQNLRAPSPEPVETFTPEAVVNSHSAPLQQMTLEQQTTNTSHDMRAPDDVIISEERSTISKRRSPVNTVVHEDEPVVQMRKPRSPMVHDSPPPPTPPKSELPPLAPYQDTPVGENSGFGPPAALLRWQRPRPKSEYPAPSLHTHQPSERTKRMSATLPYNADSKFTLDKDYSKDDSMIDKLSKPADNKPSVNRFNDTSRFEEWQQKQEEQRMPEERSSTPPIEINIHKEEHLTAQSAAPARKQPQNEAPSSAEITIPIPDYSGQAPLSPQEKFERDQQRIRLQYEEEKRQAKEAEKRKQEQEKKTLNADKFMRDMESQILQTKQEAANHHIGDIEPIRMSDTTPKLNTEPMTIRLSSNTPGRQLIIDPRNQTDNGDNMLPEYSFRVDLPTAESAPPLRTLDSGPSQEEILAREREKIREEEKRKFEEEQKRWKKEQEQKEQRLRQEQESIERQRQKLKEEQEQVERERALLEQKTRENDSYTSPYQPVNIQTYISPRSSAGSTGSPMSHSPKSPPALDPKYRESQSKKAAPPTAPKPDKGTKARLTRDDLLAMNRKATPLTKPEPLEHTASIGDNHLSPSTREPPSKGELHSLNAVPKQKFRSSAAWIKDEDVENDSPDERPFVIGKRSDLIHQRDYSNPSDHWLVREAEKRRLADSNSDYTNRRDNSESVTARAGPTKPSQSSLVSRFRGDVEPPPRTNRLSYPYSQSLDLHHSPKARPASTAGTSSRQYDRSPEPSTQFSAKTQPNSHAGNPSLSQTLPPNFSFSANARNPDGSATKPLRSLSTDDSGPVIAVSGKQKCSHCGEELGFGAAMVIESLGLYYHVQCFRCCVCRMPLGNGSEGTDVRVRVNKLHCKNCYSNDEGIVIEYWGLF